MIELPYLSDTTPFPPVSEALNDPNGLLAFGGSLSTARLFSAYSNGIFPWFSEDEPILWWSPTPRAIIELDNFHASRSLRKLARKGVYHATMNHAFEQVIAHCASIPRSNPQTGVVSDDTWITKEMSNAYLRLHRTGLAHSVEVWEGETLIGGLYGVAIGGVFCGESMFHKVADASKLALYALVKHMKARGLDFIDCQLPTEHLHSLGASSIPRETFISRLNASLPTLDEKGLLASSYRQNWEKRGLLL